ncbi:MAG: dihydropyrimidinase, partial [Oceanidesulfovibrio sp.]
MSFDCVICGGVCVTASETFTADIGIRDGTIAAMGTNLTGDRTIDATGMYVMPGAVDTHTHLEMPFGGTVSKDDFETGTIAAAFGGTTSIVDFCIQGKGQSLQEALDVWHAKAGGKAVLDYGFHIAITDMTDSVLDEMKTMIDEGYPSFKVFMVYDFRVSDTVLMQALIQARNHGGLVCVHAENNDAVTYLINKHLSEGKTGPRYHALSRPPLVEGEATGRACKLAQITGGPLFVVHLTCESALQEVVRARAAGARVMAETCPQYLLLSEDKYDEPDFFGAKYVMSPPLRPAENQAPLWKGLASNDLVSVATDHCPFDFKGQKEMGRDNFARIPNGAPGIEPRLALMHEF